MSVKLGTGERYGCGCSADYRTENEFTARIDSDKYNGNIVLIVREQSTVNAYEMKFKLNISKARELNDLLINHLNDHDVLVLEKKGEVEEAKLLLKQKENELHALNSK